MPSLKRKSIRASEITKLVIEQRVNELPKEIERYGKRMVWVKTHYCTVGVLNGTETIVIED